MWIQIPCFVVLLKLTPIALRFTCVFYVAVFGILKTTEIYNTTPSFLKGKITPYLYSPFERNNSWHKNSQPHVFCNDTLLFPRLSVNGRSGSNITSAACRCHLCLQVQFIMTWLSVLNTLVAPGETMSPFHMFTRFISCLSLHSNESLPHPFDYFISFSKVKKKLWKCSFLLLNMWYLLSPRRCLLCGQIQFQPRGCCYALDVS